MKRRLSKLHALDNFTQRVIAAIAGITIMLTGILVGEWYYYGVFLLVTTFCLWEFYHLSKLDRKLPLYYYGTLSGIALFTLSFLHQKDILFDNIYILLFPWLSMVFIIKLYKKQDRKPFSSIAFTFLGLLYIAIPFSLLNYSVYIKGFYSYEIIIGILLFHWANDTGAYFCGRFFGKTPLFPRISPKKTWEGSLGGGLILGVVYLLVSHYFHDLGLWQWAGVALIVWVTGSYGDLVESMFKRSIAIKNSGEAIPGHGGFLDRFDGFLFSMPFITALLKLMEAI